MTSLAARALSFFAALYLSALALAPLSRATAADAPPDRIRIEIGGVAREALVYAPAYAHVSPAPVLFAFHGHGGTSEHLARTAAFQKAWPEAIVVYPQGLPTPGQLTDPEGKRSGWQKTQGDQGDRDLLFFDALLAKVQSDYQVDEKRLYATGHSNGGNFTYLLWAARGDLFAAFAPTATAMGQQRKATLVPRPVLHLAGTADPLVPATWQAATVSKVREVNQCGPGEPWGDRCTRYPSKIGAPVVTYIHPGAHNLPAEAIPIIVKFLREQAKG